MFQPASLKGGSPVPVDEMIRRKYLIIYLIIILLSFIPCTLFEYYYIIYFWRVGHFWLFFLFLPINFILAVYLLHFSAIFISYLFLTIIKLIHHPKEGMFQRKINDKDYFYWNLRNLIKKWPLFLVASIPFPWFKYRFTLRVFGVKIGKKTICDNSWVSSEFVSIGKGVIIGMASTIISFGIEQDKFIIKKISIEDDVLIGAKCVLLPGTIMKRNAKLSAHSYTNYNQILEENQIYLGHPARLKKE